MKQYQSKNTPQRRESMRNLTVALDVYLSRLGDTNFLLRSPIYGGHDGVTSKKMKSSPELIYEHSKTEVCPLGLQTSLELLAGGREMGGAISNQLQRITKDYR